MFTVTYYSYKGGVGRTLALTNTAYSLATDGEGTKVAVLDFDLEAPGIDKISLFQPEQFPKKGGIVEYITNYLGRPSPDHEDLPEISPYSYPVKGVDNIWVIPSGKKDRDYQSLITTMNWVELYQQKEGYRFIEQLKERIRIEFAPDYLLIDSRTGLADISGITTHQMADIVVLVFNLNRQNLDGIKKAYRSISESPKPVPVKTILVASPVPRDLLSETDLVGSRLREASESMPGAVNSGSEGKDEIALIPYHPLLSVDDFVFVKDYPGYDISKAYENVTSMILKYNPDEIRFLLDMAFKYHEDNLLDENGPFKKEELASADWIVSEETEFADIEDKDNYINGLSYLYQVGKRICVAPYEDVISRIISKSILELVNADRSIIILVDPDTHTVDTVKGRNYPVEHFAAGLTNHSVAKGISSWVMEEKKSTRSENAQEDPRNQEIAKEHAKKFNTGPLIIAPILAGDKVLGTITAVRKLEPQRKPFTEADERLMNELADITSFAIVQAFRVEQFYQLQKKVKTLNEERSAELDKFERLSRALDAIRGANTLQDTFEQIMQSVFFVFQDAEKIYLIYDAEKMQNGFPSDEEFISLQAKRHQDKDKSENDILTPDKKIFELSIENESYGYLVIIYNKPHLHTDIKEKMGEQLTKAITKALKMAEFKDKVKKTHYEAIYECIAGSPLCNCSFIEGTIEYHKTGEVQSSGFASKTTSFDISQQPHLGIDKDYKISIL